MAVDFMELFCALLTGFFLWLFMFHLFRKRHARVCEEAGPLLLEVKVMLRLLRLTRWSRWISSFTIFGGTAMIVGQAYYVGRVVTRLSPNFFAMASYEFVPYLAIAGWSAVLLITAMPPVAFGYALEIRERGIIFGNANRCRLWSEITCCRWFVVKKSRSVLRASWTPWSFRGRCLTIRERNIAAGQKEAITAAIGRFVQVYDDDETLLAGPSPEELAARPVVQRTRFWLQFDMQSLFLLVVVVSCAASCYAIHCRRLLPQQRAVGQLETFRPAIDFFGNVPFAVDFSKCGTKPSDDDLACLESLDQLTSVNLSGSPISDVGIEHLKGLRYLNFIDCEDTKVTAKGAEELHRALPKAFISYGSAKKPIVLKPPDEK
jgi:hypothetical protein